MFSAEMCVLMIKTYFEMKSYVIIRNCFQHFFGDEILIFCLMIKHTIDHFMKEHFIDDFPCSGRCADNRKEKKVFTLIEALPRVSPWKLSQ